MHIHNSSKFLLNHIKSGSRKEIDGIFKPSNQGEFNKVAVVQNQQRKVQYPELPTVKSNFQNQKRIAILRGPPVGTVVFRRKTQPTAKAQSGGSLERNNLISFTSFSPICHCLTPVKLSWKSENKRAPPINPPRSASHNTQQSGGKSRIDVEGRMKKYVTCSGKVQQHSTMSSSGLIKFTSDFCKPSFQFGDEI